MNLKKHKRNWKGSQLGTSKIRTQFLAGFFKHIITDSCLSQFLTGSLISWSLIPSKSLLFPLRSPVSGPSQISRTPFYQLLSTVSSSHENLWKTGRKSEKPDKTARKLWGNPAKLILGKTRKKLKSKDYCSTEILRSPLLLRISLMEWRVEVVVNCATPQRLLKCRDELRPNDIKSLQWNKAPVRFVLLLFNCFTRSAL